MPSVMGSGFTKAMGPLMMAVGLGAAPFTGGATLPLAMGGFQQSIGSGGVLGPSATPGALPSIKAPALSAAPGAPPELPTPAGAGLTLSGGGTGPSPGTGAGVQSPDVLSQAIASAMGGTGANPFAAFA